MMDVPLTVGMIMRHGATVHGDSEVVTWTGDDARRANYAQVVRRAARLAGALRELGVTGDQRVATFQWNNQEHLEAYLAIPAMGAVIHTLNLRLAPEQVAWIANHAQDDVLIVDGSLVPLLARALPEMKTVRHVLVVGEADLSPLDGAGRQLHSYHELLAAQPEEFDWPTDIDERSAAAMCYTSGTTGDPKGVAYSHRSAYLHSMCICSGEAGGPDPIRPDPAGGADVSRQRLGPALRRADVRYQLDHAGPPSGGPIRWSGSSRRCNPPSLPRYRPSGATYCATCASTVETSPRSAGVIWAAPPYRWR